MGRPLCRFARAPPAGAREGASIPRRCRWLWRRKRFHLAALRRLQLRLCGLADNASRPRRLSRAGCRLHSRRLKQEQPRPDPARTGRWIELPLVAPERLNSSAPLRRCLRPSNLSLDQVFNRESTMNRNRNIWFVLLASFAIGMAAIAPASAQQQKPNILVIMGDDIGYWNISAYNRGMMGYRTPNIDRIANEGAIFTDYYGQQSCTAGRAAFITGQSPMRTGLLKVGLPGAKEGLSDRDPTL